MRELTQSVSLRQSPSQVSLTPLSTTSFTPSSKTPSTKLLIPSLSILDEDEERVSSPEASLIRRTTKKPILIITPTIEVPKTVVEPESIAETL